MTDQKTRVDAANPLLLPEIVRLVMQWIALDDNFYHYPEETDEEGNPSQGEPYGRAGVLARCCCVNQLWFDVAAPLLWEDPTQLTIYMEGTLTRIFSAVDAPRRQMYANLVESALVAGACPGEEAEESDAALRGLAFPKLRELDIPLRGWGDSAHIPRISGHNVTVLSINPSFDCYPDTYRVMQDELGLVLEQIADMFPDLEEFRVSDSCLAYPGAIEKFKSRLPKLRICDTGSVVVTDGYPRSQT